MGARQLWRLIEHLPLDSALHRAVDPEGIGSGWDRQAHLLATLAEVSDVTNNILLRVYSKKGAPDPPPPLSIPRPGKAAPSPAEPLTGPALESQVRVLGGKVVSTQKKAKT